MLTLTRRQTLKVGQCTKVWNKAIVSSTFAEMTSREWVMRKSKARFWGREMNSNSPCSGSYSMYSVHCTVYIVQCTLYSVHCTVYIVQCTLYSVHCTVYIVQCTLYSVHCTVYIVQCTLYSVHCTVYIVQCTLYSVHCTVYIVQCTLYSVHCTVYIVQCTLYSVHCTVYIVQCTLYSVHCTVYIVQCTLYSVHCTVYSVRCTTYDVHHITSPFTAGTMPVGNQTSLNLQKKECKSAKNQLWKLVDQHSKTCNRKPTRYLLLLDVSLFLVHLLTVLYNVVIWKIYILLINNCNHNMYKGGNIAII